MKKIDWEKRIRRASELAERFRNAGEVLTFYRDILSFQATVFALVSPALVEVGGDWREHLQVDLARQQLPTLLALVQQKGPSKLAKQAQELSRQSNDAHDRMLQDFLLSEASQETPTNFFARVSSRTGMLIFLQLSSILLST